jgi:hypothetical protein
MAFMYCEKCSGDLDEPTIEEDLGEWHCHQCGNECATQVYTNEEWLLSLHKRITALESQ